MNMQSVLEIRNLESGYGEAMVLKGLDLSLSEGEVVAIVGKNGMGKSTLLRTIMGFIRPKAGEISLFGETSNGMEPNQVARRNVSYIPQEKALFQDLTVEENLRLSLLHDRDFKLRFERIEDHFPVLRERLRQKAGTLSGGEQKMLLMARALIGQPKLILIDEITEGMQPSVIERLKDILGQERDKAGTAILLVEQHVDFVFAVADRYAVLNLGEIPAAGETRSASAQATVSRYLSL